MDFADFEKNAAQWESRAQRVQGAAAQAMERLLRQAETSDSGQSHAIAHFIAATFDGHVFKFDPFDLRAVDIPVSDDMLACLDALRWGRSDLHTLVPDGERRILAMCSARWLI